MASSNDSWGIEVGANALKAVRLSRHGTDVSVTDFAVLPFKKVLTTPDLNVDEAIQVQLDQFLAAHPIGKANVVVSVPGHMALARFAKLPPVDPKKIPDIVKFEAVQQIPFPIDQVEWDYQVFAQPDSPDVEVGIFAITKDAVMKFLQNYRSVNVNVDAITVSPLAVYNAMAYDLDLKPDSDGLIFMDIGTTATDLIIVENGQIWLRTLPIGGNNFTDALMRAFKLSFHKAEKLKREAATSKYARQIFQAMRPVFADLVQEIQRSLGFYQSLNRDAKLTKIIGMGSTFRLPGMLKFLKQQLQVDIVRLDGFKRAHVEGKQEAEVAENAMNLATAYGLALQGLGLEAVTANLLPRHIIQQRLWKAKQPWIAAAAAVMLVATGAAAGRVWMDEAAYKKSFAANNPIVKQVLTEAAAKRAELQRVENSADPRQAIENLRRILDYRDVWPKLMVDLDQAAQSLAPQQALLGSDYEEIFKIRPSDRRRLYIESVSAAYKFNPDGGAGDPSMMGQPQQAAPSTGGRSMKDIFGDRLDKSAPNKPPAAGPMVGQSTITPPSFVITVVGYSPSATGDSLVAKDYITWLQKNALRNNRPYRSVVSKDSFVRSLSVEPYGKAQGAPTGGGGGGGALQAPQRGRGGGRGVPAAAAGGWGAPAAVAGGNNANQGGGDVVELPLPSRPEGPDPIVRVYKFTLEWTVTLLRPEDVREFEELEHGSTPKNNGSPGTPGAPATPESPASPPPPAAMAPAKEDQL